MPPADGHPPHRPRLRRHRKPRARRNDAASDGPRLTPVGRPRFREAAREHGLILLVPVTAVLAAVTFGGTSVYVAVAFAVALAATMLLGADRYRHRRH